MLLIKEINKSEWDACFKLSSNNNLLQTWQYGEAKKDSSSWDIIRFMIFTDEGDEIGLAQFIFRGFPIVGSLARMNRGPIILCSKEKFKRESIEIKIFEALLNEFKNRNWRLVFIAPEINSSLVSEESLKKLGFLKLSKPAYSSGLIDLSVSEDSLLMGLKKKWRYSLKQSLSKNINISISHNASDVNKLVREYKALQVKNSFTGISESLIRSLSKQRDKNWIFNLFIAKSNSNDFLGMLVMIKHGDSATYVIGLTDEIGRNLNVNYALLWKAILYAKEMECKWFDIGGLDETTPKGIAHFKKGLNSKNYSLIGEWGYFKFPFSLIKFIKK